jgi:hypothetical protein
MNTRHVVQLSGGLSSREAAKRVKARHGSADLWCLFCDTLVEDADLYRFLVQGAAHLYGVPLADVEDLAERARQLPPVRRETIADRKRLLVALRADTMARLPQLVWIAEGRTPWEVYFDERFMGNSRVDPCSKILKRQLADRWHKENCDPAATVRYVGLGFNEQNRIEGVRRRFAESGWRVEFPMDDPPYLSNLPLMQAAIDDGIQPGRAYLRGFRHDNCGGECCKAGHAQWAKLLAVDPGRYAYAEANEQQFRRSVQIWLLSPPPPRRGGQGKRRMTLQQFRERVQGGGLYDADDWGACSCFAEPNGAEVPA